MIKKTSFTIKIYWWRFPPVLMTKNNMFGGTTLPDWVARRSRSAWTVQLVTKKRWHPQTDATSPNGLALRSSRLEWWNWTLIWPTKISRRSKVQETANHISFAERIKFGVHCFNKSMVIVDDRDQFPNLCLQNADQKRPTHRIIFVIVPCQWITGVY